METNLVSFPSTQAYRIQAVDLCVSPVAIVDKTRYLARHCSLEFKLYHRVKSKIVFRYFLSFFDLDLRFGFLASVMGKIHDTIELQRAPYVPGYTKLSTGGAVVMPELRNGPRSHQRPPLPGGRECTVYCHQRVYCFLEVF